MKRKLLLAVVSLLVLTAGYFIYAGTRLRVAAIIWHWRHGNVVRVADYDVPVPDRWVAMNHGDENTSLLIDTRVEKTKDPLSNSNYIDISLIPHFPGDVDLWRSSREQWLRGRGMKAIEENQIQTVDQTVACLSGNVFQDLYPVLNTNAITVECMSTGRLSLIFTGNQVGRQEFYTIISGIRKRK